MNLLTYKNRPLIRKDNIIYYGSMADKYISMIQVLSTKTSYNETVPNKILVQLLLTDEKALPRERIIKVSEKNGLYEALDIAEIWLTRALKD